MAKKNPYLDMPIEKLKQVNVETGKVEKEETAMEKVRKLNEKYSKPKEKKSESWVGKLKKKVRKLLAGDNETSRTKGVTDSLRQSGLTEKEINKFKGKKQ